MYCNNNSTERQFGYGKMEKMLGVIDKEGYEKVNRVYSIQGESPTITARDYKDPIKIVDIDTKKNIIVQSRAEQSRAA